MRWAYSAAVLVITAVLVSGIWFQIDYRLWANVSLIAVSALVTTFTLLYFLRSKWWANTIGEIYLKKSLVLSAVLLQIAVANWIDDDFPSRQSIRFVIFTLGAVVYVPMIVTLWREQQRDRQRRRDRNRN